jgi:hypothetical protein
MNKEDIIRMAREAGAHEKHGVYYLLPDELEHFAALVAEAEREALLKHSLPARVIHGQMQVVMVSDIRARSKT